MMFDILEVCFLIFAEDFDICKVYDFLVFINSFDNYFCLIDLDSFKEMNLRLGDPG